MEKPYNPFENVQTVMEEAMEVGGIDRTMFEIIRNPQRETKVYLPVEMDDGSIHVFEGWRYSIPTSVGRLRAESGFIRMSIWMKSRHWQHGCP